MDCIILTARYSIEGKPIIIRGWRVAGGELRHLAGSPGGGGGIRSCHTLVRVNTVWINNNNNLSLLMMTKSNYATWRRL